MHVVVVGAGINGLAAAWRLALRGARVTLLERFRIGHERGSSHGRSRITRSTYSAIDYVRLVRRAHAEDWPQLAHDAGVRLLHPVPGCFFGPAGPALATYTAAAEEAGAAVERLSPAEARARFPLFRFADAAYVLVDGTAAVVAAADAVAALAGRCAALGVQLREETEVRALRASASCVHVETGCDVIAADRVVVAAGPWAARLVPALSGHLCVARQTVAYLRLDAAPALQRVPRFPVWAYLGTDALHYYGLPEFGRPGIKAARHVTEGRDDDPDAADAPSAAAIAEVRAFLAAQFAVPVADEAGAETCLYTNTPAEDFVIDALPDEPRIVVAAGFSGHGFKFGPLTGRLLAELALDGRSSVPEFEAARARFAFPAASA
mgnify:CR=1 FL=1